MSDLRLVELVLGLLLAVVMLAAIARRTHIPAPILFVVGGLVISLVPGIPLVAIPSDLLLLVFIPPLVYAASVFVSPEEIRTYLWPLAFLSVGLVLLTMAVVAAVAHFSLGLDWAPAAALGAIVSSTDATAVSAISERLPMPERVVTILEGESLFNDATSLVLYRLAVAGAVASTWSVTSLAGEFLVDALGGIAIGLAVGWIAVAARRRVDDPLIEITISLLIPFIAWIPAEEAGFSGVLAVATAGIYIGRVRLSELSPLTRRWSSAFWQILTFLLEGLLFILTGLQFRIVVGGLASYSFGTLLWDGVLVSLVVIVVRIVAVFAASYFVPAIAGAVEPSVEAPFWRQVAVVAWAGMRGGESLAPALALPFGAGGTFPDRSLIIFLTFAVIFATLVLQGLSLPGLIRFLGVSGRISERKETTQAKLDIDRTVLARLDELAEKAHVPPDSVSAIRADLEHRIRDLSGRTDRTDVARDLAEQRLRQLVVNAERQEALRLREEGRISDDALHEIERDLDLADLDLQATGEQIRERAKTSSPEDKHEQT